MVAAVSPLVAVAAPKVLVDCSPVLRKVSPARALSYPYWMVWEPWV